ncbi:50S ribosomal protein L29 [bacterium M21]|nr:50S ribosomal protein L29 [bacterium M21]
MKAAEVHELTDQELEKKLEDSRRELLNLRIQAANGTLENPARIDVVRKDIARLLTVSKERQLKETAK